MLKNKKFFYRTTTFFIALILFLFLLQKINLTTADLGRHIKNGEIVLKTLSIPQINLYSYTYPNFPVLNHHWGFGVIAYLLYRIGSFKTLNIVYALTISLGIYILSKSVKNSHALLLAFLISLPLLTYRKEIRPEGFSYLFLSVDIYLIYKFKKTKISHKKFLLLYLLIQLLWVNIHIFFPFGILMLFFATIESLILKKTKETSTLLIALALSILVSLINPYFVKGVLEPVFIFKNYGYMIVENQSLFFALKRMPKFIYFYTLVVILVFISSIFFSKKFIQKNIFLFLSTLFFTILTLKYIRATPLFGILLYLFVAKKFEEIKKEITISLITIFIFFSLIILPYFPSSLPFKSPFWGLGLLPRVNDSVNFFKEAELKGPIFNNYDIGSYLIFHLYPKERVFVDNRPEAYPEDFFKQEYIPTQQDDRIWKRLEKKYNFNVIFFYRHDLTPWGQPFLIKRIKDKNWVPIYVDDYTIILVKNTKKNKEIISKYQLSNSLFKILKN